MVFRTGNLRLERRNTGCQIRDTNVAVKFSEIPQVLEELRQGKMIVLVDAEDRENEGDLVCAAEKVTPEIINFMAKFGRGLVCLPLTAEKCDSLGLYPQTVDNTARFGTAFTVSIDAAKGISTGISAADRAQTIQATIADDAKPGDLVRPGHVFPLRAREGGILVRAGQTEGAVDLMRLAGLKPAGVVCEIMNEDGSMARVPELLKFCEKHNLKIASIAKAQPGTLEACFDMTALPAMSAGAANRKTCQNGKFHGMTASTTPNG